MYYWEYCAKWARPEDVDEVDRTIDPDFEEWFQVKLIEHAKEGEPPTWASPFWLISVAMGYYSNKEKERIRNSMVTARKDYTPQEQLADWKDSLIQFGNSQRTMLRKLAKATIEVRNQLLDEWVDNMENNWFKYNRTRTSFTITPRATNTGHPLLYDINRYYEIYAKFKNPQSAPPLKTLVYEFKFFDGRADFTKERMKQADEAIEAVISGIKAGLYDIDIQLMYKSKKEHEKFLQKHGPWR